MLIALTAILTQAHALTLEVSRVSRGEPVSFTVTGGPPSATVWVVTSARLGAGPCAPSNPAVCSALEAPVVLGALTLDASGQGVLTRTPPVDTPPQYLWFEALTDASPQAASPRQRRAVVDRIPAGTTWQVDTPAEASLLAHHVWSIEGQVVVSVSPATHVSFPALEQVTGSLAIDGTPATGITFPALTSTPMQRCEQKALTIRHNAQLTSVSAPVLTQGSLCSEANGPVAYELPALHTAFMLSFQSEGRADSPPTDVSSLHLPALETAIFFDVYYTRLTSLTLPSLHTTSAPLQIWHNDWLSELAIPLLASTPLVVVRDNPTLSTCEVDDAAAEAGLHTSQVSCEDNLTEPSCLTYCGTATP